MTSVATIAAETTVEPAPLPRFTPLLLLLFVGSGCAALIYEVVWFHLMRFCVGGSSVSLGFVLGSFMGGMCLGNWLLPRVVGAHRHPLRVYAVLELLIAACGLLLPRLLPVLSGFYAEHAGAGAGNLLMRGAVCAVALLPPTMLMGATLPAVARWVGTSPPALATMGRCYGANIAGGVLGTLLAGFWLLRVYDTDVATWGAAAINGAVALGALLLAGRGRFAAAAAAPPVAAPGARGRSLVLWLAIGLSGATALGAEVVWTRLLSLLFGASVYTFSLILAVFLIGLGIGSMAGARLARRPGAAWYWLAGCQLGLLPAMLWSAWMITAVVPWLEPTYVLREFVYKQPAVRLPWDFVRCALAILPGPVLWGASFPLALLAASGGQRDAGRLVGGIAAANTIGAIAGALAVSLFAVGTFGSQSTQQGLAFAAAANGLLLAAAAPGGRRWLRLCLAALLGALAVTFARVPPTPDGLLSFGRQVADWHKAGVEYHFVAEGHDSSVAITRTGEDLNFHVAGKVEASTERTDMRLQRMLGHLPALVHGAPRKVLIVGCGAGVTAGTFCDHPSVERIVICELEPRVLDCARHYMAAANGGVLDDPRTEVVLDDARSFLLTTSEKFDVITSDPIHPWVRGAAALYSAEYYELVKRHLEPGAVVTQWVPLYQTDEASVKSQLGTFARAFPDATIWSSDLTDVGYDVAVLGRLSSAPIDLAAVDARIDANPELRRALQEVDLGSAVRLFATYAGRARDLQPWLADAQLNVDVALRLQYLAGLAVDHYDDAEIFKAIKGYRDWPAGLFRADPQREQELRLLLDK